MNGARRIAIIGGGPAGLIAAERLGKAGFAVDLYERMPSPGRKFLMAGRGGLNITHSEPLPAFLARYGGLAPQLEAAIRSFTPEAIRSWCESHGQETFIGSSGRVFPRSMKASPLLRRLIASLGAAGARLHTRHDWQGWDASGALVFASPDGPVFAKPDATLLALGGASWPRLGADGGWVTLLAQRGIATAPLVASNVGLRLAWSERLIIRFAGLPLKGIAASVGGATARGEAVITRDGLEGGVIYALSAPLRAALATGEAIITIDLKPDVPIGTLAHQLAQGRAGDSLANRLRKQAGLAPAAVALLHEQARPEREAEALAHQIKALPLRFTGLSGLERAISTAGGVMLQDLTPDFMLAKHPGLFVAGEMLDWDAPTGGYLLQATMATGVAAAEGIRRYLVG